MNKDPKATSSPNSEPASAASSPDYLPARMLNEFVYCPRLFYYEWVEGVFAHNRETIEGSLRHAKIDERSDALPAAEELDETDRLHSRSVMLASDTHGLIAKIDLIEAADGQVTPVDYKRGKPRKADDGSLELWDTDRTQLAVQALVLRDNGYTCNEAVVYYVSTKQRVRLPIDDALVAETLNYLGEARRTAESGEIPPPLIDSPKCPRCSLVGICLPDETAACHAVAPPKKLKQRTLFDAGHPPEPEATPEPPGLSDEVRRLVPARDDLRPLYLNTQGFRVGVSGNVLQVRDKNKLVQEVRIGEICQLNLFGNIQLTTQAVQALCRNEVPIAYFSQGGWFYGVTHALGLKNIFLRREQFRLADIPAFCLRLARALVAGKIRNQRTMLQRNHVEPPRRPIDLMKCLYEDAQRAKSLDELLGIEGNAARIYFENFAGMIKIGGDHIDDLGLPTDNSAVPFEPHTDDVQTGNGRSQKAPPQAPSIDFTFDFSRRNRRPPRDPVNALLSLAYSMLTKDLTVTCQIVGFDPYLGFYHQPRFGRPSLALDLMEPFRPLIADSAVLTAINTRMVTPKGFIRAGQSVALTLDGRKAFYRAYEQRMDTLVTHPMFGYRVNYRRILEIQTRLLARVLTGEMNSYPVFTTR